MKRKPPFLPIEPMLGALLVLATALFVGWCATPHSTGSTEVGIRVRKFGILEKKGTIEANYPPGATYFFAPLVNDWYTFDVKLQNLEMVKDAQRGDRAAEDDVQFKTTDGNDIRVDVTVAWRIDREKIGTLLLNVGDSTERVKEKLVRPLCRSLTRDVLNELTSEEFYDSAKRFEKADKAQKLLAERLAPEGVIVEQVILGAHHFHPEYEGVIQAKKLAEQNAERFKSEADAIRQANLRNVEQAKGEVAQRVAAARGALEQAKLAADAQFFQSQKEAEAILTEKTAAAKGIQKRVDALSGAGGRTMVKLRIAEALKGKEIWFLPVSAEGGVNFMKTDMNDLLRLMGMDAVATPGQTGEKGEVKKP